MYHMGLWSSGCKINKLVKLVKLINHGLTTAFLSYRVTLNACEMRDYLRDWTRPPFCFTVFQDNNFIQLKHVYLENAYFMLFKSVFVFNTSFRRNCPSSQFTHPSSQYTLLMCQISTQYLKTWIEFHSPIFYCHFDNCSMKIVQYPPFYSQKLWNTRLWWPVYASVDLKIRDKTVPISASNSLI